MKKNSSKSARRNVDARIVAPRKSSNKTGKRGRAANDAEIVDAQPVHDVHAQELVMSTHQGPLPPPEDLAGYEKVLPGIADRIMKLPEKEQNIRADTLKRGLSNERVAIYASAFSTLALIAVAGIATLLDNAYIAVPLGLIGVWQLLVGEWLGKKREKRKSK